MQNRWLLTGLALALACTKTEQPAAPADSGPAPTEKKSAIQVPPGDGPVAKVNGQDISRELFNREYVQTLQRYEKARHEVRDSLRERLKDNIVRRLVDSEIIAQQAKTMGVTVSPEDLEQRWAEHKNRYGSEDQFKSFLDRAGTTADDVRRSFETNAIREKVFAKVSEAIVADPAEVKDFYEKNRERYDEPEQIKASHILIKVAPGITPKEKEDRKKRAQEVLTKAKAKGASFEALAAEFGEDPTKDRGGDLGYFSKGRMVPEFEKAAWGLKVGELSGLVETQFGYHIIKKTDHKQPTKKKFEEVKEQIERSLVARKRNEAIREALENWKKAAQVEIFVKGDEAIIKADTTPMPLSNMRPEMKQVTPIKTELKVDKLPAPVTNDKPTDPQ